MGLVEERSGMLVDFFDQIIETSKEKETKQLLQEDQEGLRDDYTTLMASFSARREMLDLLQHLLADIAATGSTKQLFEVIQKANNGGVHSLGIQRCVQGAHSFADVVLDTETDNMWRGCKDMCLGTK